MKELLERSVKLVASLDIVGISLKSFQLTFQVVMWLKVVTK